MRNLLTLIFFLSFSVVYSQSIGRHNYNWVSLGAGLFHESSSTGFSGFSLYLSSDNSLERISKKDDELKKRNHFLKLRFMGHIRPGDEHNWGQFYDVGILYGKSYGEVFKASFSGGIGVLGGKYDVVKLIPPGVMGTTTERITAFNIPLDLSLSVCTKWVGFGITGFANLNSKESMTGFIVKLELGKIR